MKLEDLKVKRGDAIQPFVEKLLKFLPQLTKPYTTSKDIRLMHTPKGVNVVAQLRPSTFTPVFQPALKKLEASIGVGYVQTSNKLHQPTIDDIPLDGLVDGEQKPVPRVKLKSGPNKELRSWLVLQVTHQKDPNQKIKDVITIIHASSLEPPSPEIGWQALSMLVWKDSQTVDRVIPIVMHNLEHHFEPKLSGVGGTHFFWAI